MTKRQRENIRVEIRKCTAYALARLANRSWLLVREQALRLHEIGRLAEIQSEERLYQLASCAYYYVMECSPHLFPVN